VLPRVDASREELEADLEPFRSAIARNVDGIMTAHVAYSAIDGDNAATVSRAVITELLRRDLAYDGLVVTDAIVMEGMLQASEGSEARAALRALNAGCDAILYPGDLQAVADYLERSLGNDLPHLRAVQALRRINAAAARAQQQSDGEWGAQRDREWADGIAQRALVVSRGTPRLAQQVQLLTIDDDLGGPFAPPARNSFADTLRERGTNVTDVTEPRGRDPLVVAVYADIRAWKGSPGLSERARTALTAALAAAPDATIVLFAHPRLAEMVPGRSLLAAWGGEAVMQRAAARWLIGAAR
jgi:beta-glucosidase-like glycosyl hydrolase